MIKIKFKRLLAAYIDFFILVIISTLITNIITFGNFNLDANQIIKYISIFIYVLLLLIFILTKDLIFKNASIGKKMLKLGIFYENGDIPPKMVLINRNLVSILIFPINVLLIISKNKTSGDVKYKTKVDNLS